MLSIEVSSGLDGIVRFVYIANGANDKAKKKILRKMFPEKLLKGSQLLSANDGRDVHGPLPLFWSADGRLSG